MCFLRISILLFLQRKKLNHLFTRTLILQVDLCLRLRSIYIRWFVLHFFLCCVFDWMLLDYMLWMTLFLLFCCFSPLLRSRLHHRFSKVFQVVLMMKIISVRFLLMEDMHLLPHINLNLNLPICLFQPKLLRFPRYAVFVVFLCRTLYLMVESK